MWIALSITGDLQPLLTFPPVPLGTNVLRSPSAPTTETREWPGRQQDPENNEDLR